jgi:hypothetical protein
MGFTRSKVAVILLGMLGGWGCGPLNVGTLDGGGLDSGSGPDAGLSLIGTWDVTITQTGQTPVTGVVVIGNESLQITSGNLLFTVLRSQNQLTFTDAEGTTSTVVATQSAAPFAGGVIPFSLGGSWDIVGGGNSCAAQIAPPPGQLTSTCNGAMPYQSLTLNPGSRESSVFGDFGGAWALSWTFQSAFYACGLEFKDARIAQTCISDGGTDINSLIGTTVFQLDVGQVSGTAPQGIEFYGTRR